MSACTDASHQAAVASDAAWNSFKRKAIWVLAGQRHDMRNCPHCDSSFDRVIPKPPAMELQWIPVITLEQARQVFTAVEAEMAVAL